VAKGAISVGAGAADLEVVRNGDRVAGSGLSALEYGANGGISVMAAAGLNVNATIEFDRGDVRASATLINGTINSDAPISFTPEEVRAAEEASGKTESKEKEDSKTETPGSETPNGGNPAGDGSGGSSPAEGGGGVGPSGTQPSGGVLGFHSGKSPAVVVVAGPITSKAGVVSVPLRCTATSGSCAPATVHLAVVEQLRNGRVTAIAATKKSKTTKRTVVIGSATLTLIAGQSETVKVSLNSVGKKLLAQYKKLAAQVQVLSEGQTLKTQIVSIVQAKPLVKKKH
jgi:hypothetical protein